jgi:hypothetical protein
MLFGFVHYFVCPNGPFDTLIIFTATISVISTVYITGNVVMVPIIWLCITVVVVMISFSVIVLCVCVCVFPYC